MSFSAFETRLMGVLLRLADRRRGLTYPNPLVASAVFSGQKILGLGVHQKAGGPHAEVFALAQAGDLAQGASIMVTLEPCTHTGKTGPCAQAIINAGISRVIFAVKDADSRVRTSPATAILEAHGIQVQWGLLEHEAVWLNRIFFKNKQHQMPWVVLKVGMSQDRKVAPAEGQGGYITNGISLRQVHRMRGELQAIIVGAGTVRVDDPQLTIRYGLDSRYSHPVRVILDPSGTLPLTYKVFLPSAPVIWCVSPESAEFLGPLPSHITRLVVPHTRGRIEWKALLAMLFQRDIGSVMIESGPTVMRSALDAGIVDELAVFQAPVCLGPEAVDVGITWEDQWVPVSQKMLSGDVYTQFIYSR